MEKPNDALAVIKEWRRKCFEHSSESNDALLSLFAKGFDTIAVFASPNSDSASILRSLDLLANERNVALKYENRDFDVLRHFSFGLIESFERLIKTTRGNRKEQAEEALALIKEWRRKCFEHSSELNDPLLSLFAKGFDTMAVIASPFSDSAAILRSLDLLQSERQIALQYESKDFDVLRHFSFGFIEVFNLLMKIQSVYNHKEQTPMPNDMDAQKLNLSSSSEVNIVQIDDFDHDYKISNLSPSHFQVKIDPMDYCGLDDEVFNPNPSYPIEPRDEPVDSLEVISSKNQITLDAASNGELSEENKIAENISRVSMRDDSLDYEMFNSNLPLPIEPRDESVGSLEVVSSNNQITLDVSSNGELSEENKITVNILRSSMKDDLVETEENLNDHSIDTSKIMLNATPNGNLPDGNEISEKIPRVARGDGQVDNEENMDDPASDAPKDSSETIEMQRRRRSSRVKDIDYTFFLVDPEAVPNKPKSHKRKLASTPASMKCKVSRLSNADLECPECEFRSRSVGSWYNHLKLKHCTTPKLAGLALRCECGHKSFSYNHMRECNSNNYTVIRTRDGAIMRTADEKNNEGAIGETSDPPIVTPEESFNESMGERPTRSLSELLRNTESTEDSAEDTELVTGSMSLMRRERDNTMSNGQEMDLNLIMNKFRGGIINQTDLECPECEYRSRSVVGWVQHLRRAHATTLTQAGLAILCDCGIETQSDGHVRTCNIANVTVVRKSGVPIGGLDLPESSDSEPLTKQKSKENNGETSNRRDEDSFSANENSMSKGTAINTPKGQNINANVANETRKVAKENDTDLKCPECEYRTTYVPNWLYHMKRVHSTNPYLAGLALRCKCGEEVLSAYHSYKCEISQFTIIRKRDGSIMRLEDAKKTPKCVLCEIYPRTACGYEAHMRLHHKSTIKENKIYLKCVCGMEVRDSYKNTHSEKCDPRQFTLHKVEDE